MGYSVTRFLGQVDVNLLCSICSCMLQDAVLTPCGHSFCQLCLDTWLARPGPGTCPECRGRVSKSEVRPILSVRNLINAMEIYCDHKSRGCRTVVKLESLSSHMDGCSFSPVECAGCGRTVNRGDLAEHHMRCEAIAAAIRDDEDHPSSSNRITSCCTTRHPLHSSAWVPEVAELACRVATLELQLKRMKRDLEAAEIKNRKLDRELKRTKEDLEEKRNQLLDQQYVDFDPDYDYGFTPNTISKLSCFLARFLLKKPAYIDRHRMFSAVKRCYDNFGRSSDEYEHDVHMLIATAYASNWFTENQKLNFHCWIESLSRHRQLAHNMATSRIHSRTSTLTRHESLEHRPVTLQRS